MQKITPFLWFDGNAEEAANFYISIFKNSKMGKISRYGDAGPGPKGTAMSVTFQLEGQEFYALNGGPQFKFTPAISLFVNCETQQEVDELWEKLSAGGRTDRCGWLQDKFGLSWQIIPTVLGQLLGDKDPQRAKRAMQAMLQMTKLDIKKLQQAADDANFTAASAD
jgi:predicted 3-demethylubiquinone-9 3-methyltransferase (glyoxalase superfamily)